MALLTGGRIPLRGHCTSFVAALLVAAACLYPVAARETGYDQDAEVRIKAAFLYKFGSYVEWPQERFSSDDSPFVIGVLNAGKLAGSLREIVQDRTVADHPVAVRELEPGTPLDDVHVLFVGRDGGADLPKIVSDLPNDSVLIVTESADSISAGSIINFVIADNRVRFDVGLDSAHRRGLRISARLLGVARKVYGEQS